MWALLLPTAGRFAPIAPNRHAALAALAPSAPANQKLRRCKVTQKRCMRCEKPMTDLEIHKSKMGDEFDNDIVCDECFDAITLEIAKGAFPSVFSDEV